MQCIYIYMYIFCILLFRYFVCCNVYNRYFFRMMPSSGFRFFEFLRLLFGLMCFFLLSWLYLDLLKRFWFVSVFFFLLVLFAFRFSLFFDSLKVICLDFKKIQKQQQLQFMQNIFTIDINYLGDLILFILFILYLPSFCWYFHIELNCFSLFFSCCTIVSCKSVHNMFTLPKYACVYVAAFTLMTIVLGGKSTFFCFFFFIYLLFECKFFFLTITILF